MDMPTYGRELLKAEFDKLSEQNRQKEILPDEAVNKVRLGFVTKDELSEKVEKKTINAEEKINKTDVDMGFFEAIAVCFRKFADFSGRARRKEYWSFILFSVIVSVCLNLFLPENEMVRTIYSGFLLLPTLAVSCRRLHDVGKSGAWYALWFAPVIGWIFLIIWLCKDSQLDKNAYGENPKKIRMRA